MAEERILDPVIHEPAPGELPIFMCWHRRSGYVFFRSVYSLEDLEEEKFKVRPAGSDITVPYTEFHGSIDSILEKLQKGELKCRLE